MMKTPINTELWHLAPGYDPQKAHDYYLRTRKLKGRQPGTGPQGGMERRTPRRPPPKKNHQKKELAASIQNLEKKLHDLEELIKKKEAVLKKNAKNAKKNSAAKAKDKPKTAADKAKAARENKQYRQKHHQTLKTKAKQASAKGGGSHGGKAAKPDSQKSIADLKALATKVKGQLAVAKQKLAAL